MKKVIRPGFFLIIVMLSTASASALDVVPFYTRNQHPLMQIFGLPAAEEGALTPRGKIDARLVLDISNVFAGNVNETTVLRLDGEIYRTTMALRYGLSSKWEMGVDIPYVRHEGGRFDGLIDGFHRTFGLPEGGRDRWYKNGLRYAMVIDGAEEFYFTEPDSGLGDIRVAVSRQLTGDGPGSRPVALRVGLKLPTGEADRFTGSESTDVSLHLTGTDAVSLARRNLTWYWGAGGMWLSRGEILPDHQRRLVGFGTLGLGWQPLSWFAFKVQFDGHTPFYRDFDLVQLDSSSVQVVLGASFALPGKILFDFGITEDLIVNSAPDVVFHFALRRRF